MSSGVSKLAAVVTDIVKLNDLVTRFKFAQRDGALLPPFSGGAHSVVEMRDGDKTMRNPYSLMSDPADQSAYMISVRRDDQGRGGSLFMHNKVRIGDAMTLGYPVNLFALDLRAKKHLMLAGGIGITPFLAQIKQLAAAHGKFELHYTVRTPSLGSYVDELTTQHPHHVHVYYDDQDQKIALDALLAGQPLGTHIYVCGPKGMIAWVRGRAEALGWPREAVHYEEFLAPPPGKVFQAKLAASNKMITVGEQQSLLEAIEAAGVDAPYLCRGGACGQCETNIISCDGKILHNDHWLDADQIASKTKIMPCVSRFEGKSLVLDR